MKAMTIQLSPQQAEELETIADVDQLPVSEVVRAAISEHIDTRRADAEFRRSLRERLDRARRLLDE